MSTIMRSLVCGLLASSLMAFVADVAATGVAFRDPLDTPAPTTRLGSTSSLASLAEAGKRLVAVGARGLIIVSSDQGKSWQQVACPISSDLVSVRFVTPMFGFATGHDGIVLSSRDGGVTWAKSLDGRIEAALLTTHFTQLAGSGDAEAERLLKEVRRDFGDGPEMPVLDVWFDSPDRGWVVGPFGIILGTEDGGRTWQSWMERVDNPKMLHYNAIRRVGDDLLMASEQGVVFKLDPSRGRFVAMQTGYKGSFFGIAGTRDYLLAFGLRGSLFRSRDHGATWQSLSTGVAGGLNDGVVTSDGQLLLVSQDGHVVVSRDQGDSFKSVQTPIADLFTAITAVAPNLAFVTGLRGVNRLELN